MFQNNSNPTALLAELTTPNLSISHNSSEELWPAHLHHFPLIFLNTFYAIIFCVGVGANIFVIVLIARCSINLTVTSIYVFNLAVADLCFLIWIPFVIARSLIGQWIWGMVMCKLYFISTTVNQFGSVAFLTALSVDRYLAVCHPIQSLPYRTRCVAFISSFVGWTIVASLMTPIYMYSTVVGIYASHTDLQTDHLNDQNASTLSVLNSSATNTSEEHSPGHDETDYNIQCMIMWPRNDGLPFELGRSVFTLYTGLLGFVTPVTIIWTLYGLLLAKLFCKRRRTSNRFPKRKQSSRKRASLRKVTKMVFAVVICYTICWAPFWMVQFVIEFWDQNIWATFPGFQYISLAAYCLQSTNSLLNPILYCFISGTYNMEFYKMCPWLSDTCFCGCGDVSAKKSAAASSQVLEPSFSRDIDGHSGTAGRERKSNRRRAVCTERSGGHASGDLFGPEPGFENNCDDDSSDSEDDEANLPETKESTLLDLNKHCLQPSESFAISPILISSMATPNDYIVM